MVEGRKRSKKSTTNSRQDAPSSATSGIDFCCCWRERTSGVQAPPPLSGGDQTRRYLRLARPSRPPVDLCARITASGSLWRSFPTLWIANETVCEIQRGCIAYHNAMTCHADTRVCTYNYIMFDMGMSESETHQPDAQTRVRAPEYTSVAGLFLACIKSGPRFGSSPACRNDNITQCCDKDLTFAHKRRRNRKKRKLS